MTDRKLSDDKLAALADRIEIQDVLARYVRGVDRADEALLKSCYHADAIEEHGSVYQGLAHRYFEAAIPRLQTSGPMAHYITSTHIEFDGADRAYVETYVLTFFRIRKNDQDYDTLTGGRYCDRFERRDGVWRIAHRKLSFDWNRDMAPNEAWCQGHFDWSHPAMNRGTKDKTDISYSRF